MNTTVAVLVATKNRAASLRQVLQTLSRQILPPEVELQVVVIDNGSTDSTRASAEEFARQSPPFQMRVLTCPTGGKSAALNLALRGVAADLVLFTDDDMLLDPQWVAAFVRHFQQCDCVGALGAIEPHCGGGWPEWATSKIRKLYGSTEGVAAPDGTVQACFGGNMAARLAAARLAGDFNEQLGPAERRAGYSEDVEWSKRLGQHGRLCFCPEAKNLHCVSTDRLSKKTVWWRQFGMTRDEWRLKIRSAEVAAVPHLLTETRRLLAALVVRRGKFDGFELGLEIAARCGRVAALAEGCLQKFGLLPRSSS